MKRLLVILVTTLGCDSIFSPEPTGELSIFSTPDHASIYIDDQNMKTVTPDTLTISIGDHVVTLKKEHFAPTSVSMKIKKDRLEYINIYLDEQPRAILVRSNPSGANVFWEKFVSGSYPKDFEDTGKTTPCVIGSGEYIEFNDPNAIRVNLKGAFASEIMFVPQAQDTTEIVFNLDPIPNDLTMWVVKADTIFSTKLDGIQREVRLLDHSGYGFSQPPGNEYIVYNSNGPEEYVVRDQYNTEIWTFSVPGSLSSHPWSSTLQHVLSSTFPADDLIYSTDVETNISTVIFDGPSYVADDHEPAYSPNDSLIAFVHHEYGTDAWLKLMNADGSNIQTIGPKFSTGEFNERIETWWKSNDIVVFKESGSGIYEQHIQTGERVLVASIPDVRGMTFNRDQTRCLFSALGGVFVANTATWTITKVMDSLNSQLSYGNFFWANDELSFTTSASGGIWWITFDGRAYHVIDDSDPLWTKESEWYPVLGGAAFWD